MKSTKSSFLKRLADKSGVNAIFHRVKKDKFDYSLEYISCPAESTLVHHGNIGDKGRIISKHNKIVALEDVIGKHAEKFKGGIYLNLYLSPFDDHYFRIPYNGRVEYIQKNDGAGNPIMIGRGKKGMKYLAYAFYKNATIGVVVNAGKFNYTMIAVGSVNVNHITVVCEEGKKYKKAKYAGHFSLGSTVILCFDSGFAKNSSLLINTGDKLKIGDNIIKINPIYEL